jgi:hypothetical protein
VAAAAGLAGLLLLAACSSGGGSNSAGGASTADQVAAGGGARAANPPAKADAPSGTSGGSQAGTQPEARIAPSRALIRRAELTVRVTDVAAKARELGRIADDSGGSIYSDDRTGAGDTATANVVLKIDPDRLDAALGRVAALGHEVQRTTSTEDVTEEVADVDSRVASMKASIARVRAILSRASSVGDVVSVEGELSRRETELESLQARQRALAGQVAQATLTVHLLAEQAPAPAPAGKTDRGFLTGLRNGWDAFANTVGWLLTVLGAILPFLLIGLPVLAGWWVLTQRQRRGGAVATPAPQPPAA